MSRPTPQAASTIEQQTQTEATKLPVQAVPTDAPSALKGWERYNPGSYKAIKAKFLPEVLKDGEGLFLMAPKDAPAFRARVVYTGKSRKLTGERLRFVQTWGKTLTVDKKFLSTFANEFLFTEDGAEHWMPVQTQLMSHFKKELKAGGDVVLYSMWIGSNMKSTTDIDWYFLINEFQKP